MKQLLHTPEGVRDIYDREFAGKLEIQQRIRKTLNLYGYRDIQTPAFEFFDIFRQERGSVASQEMFKFFDRDGNTMVLRPDFTPSIARCAAKYYMEEDMPVRLSYMGKCFINYSSLQGRLKECTQAGVELIGDGSAQADAEVIALVVECLKKAGLEDFQIEAGHAGFLKGLLEEAGFSPESEETFLELMKNKNYFGAETFLKSQPMKEDLRSLFLKLLTIFDSPEQLSLAKKLTENETALEAIDRLEQLYQILKYYGVQKYVSFDLGMTVKYRYYTGVIFKAYTYGTGESIVSGGRYDELLGQFGKNATSIGFAINIDNLLAGMARQGIKIETKAVRVMVLFEESGEEEAIALAKELRSQEICAVLFEKEEGMDLDAYSQYAKRNGVREIRYIDSEGRSLCYRLKEEEQA